jgi:hypothetical protein
VKPKPGARQNSILSIMLLNFHPERVIIPFGMEIKPHDLEHIDRGGDCHKHRFCFTHFPAFNHNVFY